MSITDELRRWAEDRAFVMGESGFARRIADLCDRIDAEHESKVGCTADEWDYWESTHVELPKDADGEVIHIGDEMEWCDSGETLTVEGIGSDVLFYIDGENAEWTAARNKRHHYAPTVEDVLREFVDQYAFYSEIEGGIHPDVEGDEMSITDELRKWGYGFCGDTYDVVTAIADRIDAEHERQMVDAFETRNSDENLEADGWMRLPKDADGKPIHVGDELENVDNPSSHGEVHRIELTPDTCWVFVNGFGRTSNHYRHYHKPTVEDVLREFADQYAFYSASEGGIHPDLKAHEEVLRQFAAKLRLAGDAE